MDGPFFEKKLYVYKLYNITYLKAALTSSSRLTCFCRELTATLRKSSQVKVPSQSQPASQTRFITSSSVGFWPKERRTYPTSLHWIASSPWKNGNNSIFKIIDRFVRWFHHFFQPLEAIQCKEVGYVLRSLGKNPTEDEVINLVCEAACDWEGTFTCDNFLSHSQLLKLGWSPHLRLDSDPRSEERIWPLCIGLLPVPVKMAKTQFSRFWILYSCN